MTKDSPLRVLLILGHPRRDSLCGALADAYAEGAIRAGVELRRIDLGALSFAHDVIVDSPENQPLEPDLRAAADDLAWAEHLVLVYPNWWGTMPALLKGFVDRMVQPGEAFRFYGPGATQWRGLWADKSAQLVTTMDTPPPIYRLLFRAPGVHAMRDATFGFCGVRRARALLLGPVRTSDGARRAIWLEKARKTGFALRRGVRSPLARLGHGIKPWLAVLRLQFYPMAWAAYSLGAVAAAPVSISWAPFWWGLLFIMLLEAATVFCNEQVDLETDRRNANHGPFTGGSRVLVTGALSPARLRRATGLVLIGVLVTIAAGLSVAPMPWAVALWMLITVILTLGYTVKPLRLCYRGLGELDVCITHSLLVLLLGGLLQGASLLNADLWLLAVPLAPAIFPAIILSGVPDREADGAVGKRTLCVRFGARAAFGLAGLGIVAAAALAIGFEKADLVHGAFDGLRWFVLPHAALALGFLWWYQDKTEDELRRIDGLLVVALTYIVWFVVVPWVNLL